MTLWNPLEWHKYVIAREGFVLEEGWHDLKSPLGCKMLQGPFLNPTTGRVVAKAAGKMQNGHWA